MKKNVIKFYATLLMSPLLLGLTSNADAAIYKCVNSDAKVYYNDKPCPYTEVEKKIKSVKDPVGGYIPPTFVEDEKEQLSKGVVVGNQEDLNSEDSAVDNTEDENTLKESDYSNSSDSDASNANAGSNEIAANRRTGVKKRKRPKASRKTPKPKIHLKREKVTKEARVRLQ